MVLESYELSCKMYIFQECAHVYMSKNFLLVCAISESNRESSSKITVLVLCSGKYGTQDLKDGCDSPAAKQAGAKVNLGCLESLLEFEGELQGKQTGRANWESKLQVPQTSCRKLVMNSMKLVIPLHFISLKKTLQGVPP